MSVNMKDVLVEKFQINCLPFYCMTSESVQTHFQQFPAFAARFLKCLLPFWDIIHQRLQSIYDILFVNHWCHVFVQWDHSHWRLTGEFVRFLVPEFFWSKHDLEKYVKCQPELVKSDKYNRTSPIHNVDYIRNLNVPPFHSAWMFFYGKLWELCVDPRPAVRKSAGQTFILYMNIVIQPNRTKNLQSPGALNIQETPEYRQKEIFKK